MSSVHVCVQSVRKKIREDMEDRWVTNLRENRKRFYLVSSLLDPHTKMLLFCDNKYFPSSWKDDTLGYLSMDLKSFYVALSMEVCEVKYLRMRFRELGCPQEEPTLIWEDNKTCILLAENESSSTGRFKHIDTKFRFVAEAISDGVVKIRYTPSVFNYSDILTKSLTEVMFQRMIEMCLGSKDSQIVERGHQMEGFLCTGYDSYMVYIC